MANDSGDGYLNPYHPFMPRWGRWFYNQEAVCRLQELLTTKKKTKVILFQGNPGSGKTGTLRNIANTPQKMLGPGFIPIYIDLRDYITLRTPDFVDTLFKDIIANISMYAFSDNILEPAVKNKIDGNTGVYIKALTSFLSSGQTFLLVCDEFDRLLENPDKEKTGNFITHFQAIEKKHRNFWLLFALNKEIVDFPLTQVEKNFLESSSLVKIREFLEPATLKEMIIKPVEHLFIYDFRAVDEIIRMSGKNLYFQQLICFYIFNQMESSQSFCDVSQVDTAVEQLLNQPRPELDHAWENLLSLESKLILSALADENVTIPFGQFYHLGENGLLDDILTHRFPQELKKLYETGLVIGTVENRRFPGNPVRIPVLGKWIRKEHPFLKTIIENIDRIGNPVDLEKLTEEITRTPEEKLLPFDKVLILDITGKWLSLKGSITRKKIRTGDLETVSYFVKSLAKFVNLKVKTDSAAMPGCVKLDIKSLNIGTLNDAYCFIQSRPAINAEDIAYIEHAATSYSQEDHSKLTIYFCLEKNDLLEDLVKKAYLNIAAVEESDLKKVMLADQPFQVFRRVILSKLSLQKVSPYQTTGPAKATFYGRSKTIDLVCGARNRSFAIVGARKIGKSSLLYKIAEQSPPNTDYIFMDMQIEINSYEAFLKALELEIQRTLNQTVGFEGEVSNMPGIFRGFFRQGKRIIFILDEIDHLIEFDREHNYKILKIFRSMAQNNFCQFVLAGFKTLYRDKRDIESPLYNFCEEIQLTPLEKEAALDLITSPMKSIGVEYQNPSDRELIMVYTVCHPNLIQFFGKHLIDSIEKHEREEDRRTIFREDIEKLFDTRYEEYIIDEIYMIFSDINDLNKLIIIMIIEETAHKETVSTEEIKKKLMEQGINLPINRVQQDLKLLEMRFILKDSGKGRFSFALPVFPGMLKKRIDEDFKATLLQELNSRDSGAITDKQVHPVEFPGDLPKEKRSGVNPGAGRRFNSKNSQGGKTR